MKPPLSLTALAAFVIKRSRVHTGYCRGLSVEAFGMVKSKAAIEADGLVIIGGGIAGLAVATALRNVAGVSRIKILEASSRTDFTNNKAGAAAQLGPNGLRALKFITSDDFLQKVFDMGAELEGNVVMNMQGGQSMVIPDTTKADTGIPQILIRWGTLRSLLAEQLPEDTVIVDSRRDIAGYSVSARSDSRLINLINSSGGCFDMPKASLIVGADGVKSTFRALIRKSTKNLSTEVNCAVGEDVKYGGRINIKAVVNKTLGVEYKSSHTYASFAPDGSVAVFAGRAGDNLTYWAISVADSANEEGHPTTTFIEDLPTGADGRLLSENLKEKLLAKLRALNSDQYIESVIDLIDSTPSEDIYYQKSEEAIELGEHPLHSDDGHIVLAGDAAHAFSASYGQAANFALEDAATLAACIRDSDDLKDALRDYSKKRLDRCIEMQSRSAERAAKAMKGEHVEDVSKWIFQWDIS